MVHPSVSVGMATELKDQTAKYLTWIFALDVQPFNGCKLLTSLAFDMLLTVSSIHYHGIYDIKLNECLCNAVNHTVN